MERLVKGGSSDLRVGTLDYVMDLEWYPLCSDKWLNLKHLLQTFLGCSDFVDVVNDQKTENHKKYLTEEWE